MDFDDFVFDNNDISIDTELIDSELLKLDKQLPSQLYIIPIRYRPIFPGIITPLIISEGRFTRSIDKVLSNSRAIGLVLIKDDEKDEIESTDLYRYGTAAKILKKLDLPDGSANLLINSMQRIKITNIVSNDPFLIADVQYLTDQTGNKSNIELKALTREVRGQLKTISDNNPLFTDEMKLTMLNVEEPGKIADFVTSILNLDKKEYQGVLEILNVKKRLQKVLNLLHKEMEILSVQKKIHVHINDRIEKQQREFILREQLKSIKQELGIEDEKSTEVREMRKKADNLNLRGEVKEKIEEEINKIALMETTSSEYTVSKNYIELALTLPWNTKSVDIIDINRAARILDRDHYGLNDIKERILEFLAVRKLNPGGKGSIICLVGPPGVGKTSIGKSIARAINRKFFRISLGGMRDEAEIKGHRRTYIGAMPGKIIQGIKICKHKNPVFMLDEIDKLGQSFQGDPASALLEVLDPEQNIEFRDYYLDLPFDLSEVLFITTANTLDTIPRVLSDRMEIIRIPGYITEEKYQIARRYLLPKQLTLHGLKKRDVKIDKKGFHYIIEGWAREAGVRNLERQTEKICRKIATLIARRKKIPEGALTEKKIAQFLGPELYFDDDSLEISKPGMAPGLAWTSLGGVTMVIESIAIKNGKVGNLKLTGQLGDVMTESADIAYSYIRHNLQNSDKAEELFNSHTIHIHVPAGATPKDGPSAGITLAASLYSLATQKIIRRNIAMTGELTLTGKVLPIGGLKEKVIAARRAKIKEIIIPQKNTKELKEIPDYIVKGMTFHPVSHVDEVLDIAFKPRGKTKGKKKK